MQNKIMKITKIINYKQSLLNLGPNRLNFINVSCNVSYSTYNKQLNRDTISFTSKGNDDYRERMSLDSYQRMEDRVGTRFRNVDAYIEALKEFNVKDYIRLGGESVVFELNSGNILKLSCEEYTPYIPKYHAPEIDRGVIKLSRKYPVINNYFEGYDIDEVYFVIQKKGDIATTGEDAIKLWHEAKMENLYTYDYRYDQFAYFDTPNGRMIKCIDLGCITDSKYPILRNLKAIDKMPPRQSCRLYGLLFNTLKDHFASTFANNSDRINDFVKSVKLRLEAGESIFNIIAEITPQIKHNHKLK